jgi:predicted ArsR family transcriptional regulator
MSGPGSDDLAVLSSLDEPVRRRLYQMVAERGEPVSRDDAAAAVGIGRALAAYHLDKLVESGLLTAAYRRPPGRSGTGAGRPAKAYSRSEREFAVTVPPREYGLAARLLARAVASDRSGDTRATLREAARQVGAELGREHRSARPATRHSMDDALREHGFEPWRDEDGTIRLANCPFHDVAARHPDVVCDMNLALIEGLAASVDDSTLRPALDPQPGRCCVAIPTGGGRRDA